MTGFVTLLQSFPYDFSVGNALQLLLSILLAGLYYFTYRTQKRQAEIQETQSKLMEKQTELMATEHRPKLKIKNLDIDGETLSLTVSNIGKERARDLRVRCYVHHRSEEDESYKESGGVKVAKLPMYPREVSLSRVSESVVDFGFEASRNTGRQRANITKPPNGLRAKEEAIRFEADVKYGPVDWENINLSIKEVCNHLKRKYRAEEIAIEILLLYTDIVDEVHSLDLVECRNIDLEEDMSLEAALEKGDMKGHSSNRFGVPSSSTVRRNTIRSQGPSASPDF